MPRAIWTGSISFGLVNIPVRLYPAVSRKQVHFNQIDTRTQSRIKQKRVSEADGSEVPYESVARGYQLTDGRYVIVDDAELASLDPAATRTIDIEEFVELADIDPLFYDGAYLAGPDKATTKPYALLVRAMESSGRVAIARFVMRTKQYLAAVRAQDGHLVVSTLVYADEVVDATEVPEIAAAAEVEVSDREVAMAEQLIASLSTRWEPAKFEDTYRAAVLELIERKASGAVEVTAPVVEEGGADRVVDLMAALEASVAAAKDARKRHPTAAPAPDVAEPARPARPARAKRVKKSA
ncbi:MAG: Ku protein [Actinobacteria bacterium]|nr:Ku protein [Actinomycetota bacterium]